MWAHSVSTKQDWCVAQKHLYQLRTLKSILRLLCKLLYNAVMDILLPANCLSNCCSLCLSKLHHMYQSLFNSYMLYTTKYANGLFCVALFCLYFLFAHDVFTHIAHNYITGTVWLSQCIQTTLQLFAPACFSVSGRCSTKCIYIYSTATSNMSFSSLWYNVNRTARYKFVWHLHKNAVVSISRNAFEYVRHILSFSKALVVLNLW